MSSNVIQRLMQDTSDSWQSQKPDNPMDTSEEIISDYAIHSAHSQDNTCGNKSPLSSEDEQHKDCMPSEVKQGKEPKEKLEIVLNC